MAIVLRELEQWYGKKEGVITKTDNYHKLVGWGGIKTLVGTKQAWCASFANYCLQEAKYTKSKDTVSALSFRRDSQNFVKIDKPIFGALATIPTFEGASSEATSGTGHVAFVYSLDKTDGRFLMIGGNQDDQITIVDRKISSFRFYRAPFALPRPSQKGNTLVCPFCVGLRYVKIRSSKIKKCGSVRGLLFVEQVGAQALRALVGLVVLPFGDLGEVARQ